MRVAVDCHMVGQPGAGDAGNGRYAAQLVEALCATASTDDQVGALIAHGEARGQLPEQALLASVGTGNVHRMLRGAPAMLRALGAEAAVFTYVSPPRTSVPVVLAVHDTTFLTNPEWLPLRARLLLQRLVRPSALRADAVLALSSTARAEICDHLDLPDDHVHVVSPAPGAVFGRAPGADSRVADRFGLERFCLAVGDLGPRKNLETLRAALQLLDDRLPLVVVGRGTPPPAWRHDPMVHVLGYLEDELLADLYRAATVTVFPSLHEGFGLPAVEALACGSPLVVSNRGALPEVVGDAAIVARPDVTGLSEAIRAALESDTADRLRRAGPERASAYGIDAMGRAAWRVLTEGRRR